MQVGSAHEFERIRKDGRVIQMRGNPMKAAVSLPPSPILPPSVKMKPYLKPAVQDRTQQLADALSEQQLAREQADKANI